MRTAIRMERATAEIAPRLASSCSTLRAVGPSPSERWRRVATAGMRNPPLPPRPASVYAGVDGPPHDGVTGERHEHGGCRIVAGRPALRARRAVVVRAGS